MGGEGGGGRGIISGAETFSGGEFSQSDLHSTAPPKAGPFSVEIYETLIERSQSIGMKFNIISVKR